MNVTGKYLKVWKKTEGENYIKLDLGEGEKKYNSDEYQNWTWFGCFLAGQARMKTVNEGDKIEIKSGKITMSEYSGKWSPNVTIFEFEVMESASGAQMATPPPSADTNEFEDDIPI